MRVYNRESNNIFVYEVTCDVEKLKVVKERIKENCSIIIEKSFLMTSGTSTSEDLVITSSRRITDIEQHYGQYEVYDNQCKIYVFPEIVKSINSYLKGNQQAIGDIFEQVTLNLNYVNPKDYVARFTGKSLNQNELVKINSYLQDLKSTSFPSSLIGIYEMELFECFDFKFLSALKQNDSIANMIYMRSIPDEKEIYKRVHALTTVSKGM